MKRFGLWAALLALVVGAWGLAADKGGKKEGAGTRSVLVVHARRTARLSARLRAVQLTDGKVLGRAPRNGLVVGVPAARLAACEKRLKAAGARVSRKAPAKP